MSFLLYSKKSNKINLLFIATLVNEGGKLDGLKFELIYQDATKHDDSVRIRLVQFWIDLSRCHGA